MKGKHLIVFCIFLSRFVSGNTVTDSLLSYKSHAPQEILKKSVDTVNKLISNYFNSWDIIYAQDTSSTSKTLEILIPDDAIRLSVLLDQTNLGSDSFRADVRRHNIQSTLTVTVLNEGISFLGQFDKILTGQFLGPTKRDEDYFLFLAPAKEIEPILSHPVGQTIRFKLALPFELDDESSSFTRCFYCAPGGKPKLLSIQIEIGMSFRDVFPEFTRNGNGYTMRTSSPVKYKFTTEIRQLSPGKWELVRGISKKIMDGVLPHHNYTYVVFSSPNGDTGLPDKNGSWNGCIGQLIAGEADLSLTTSANPSRFKVIGFSTSAFYGWITFSTGQPKITYTWKAIFEPFTWSLWLALFATVAGVCLVFKVFDPFEHSLYKRRAGIYKELVVQITFSLLGIGVDEPEANFSRVLLGWWLLVALIFNSLYNSKIVGLLAMPVYEMPPKTFEELANSQTFKWGTDAGGGSLYQLFKTSESPIFQKIFKNLEKPRGTIGCFQQAVDSNFACITWVGVSDYISYSNFTIVDGKLPILRARDIVNFVACALAMARHAVFKPVFDRTISMIYDAGIGERWIQDDLNELQSSYLKWEREGLNRTVLRYANDGPEVLKLDNILGVYYIYAVGHILSLLGFFIERKYRKKQRPVVQEKAVPYLEASMIKVEPVKTTTYSKQTMEPVLAALSHGKMVNNELNEKTMMAIEQLNKLIIDMAMAAKNEVSPQDPTT